MAYGVLTASLEGNKTAVAQGKESVTLVHFPKTGTSSIIFMYVQ